MRTLGIVILLTAVVAVSPAWSSVRPVQGGILFQISNPSASSVFVAGDFNGWSTTETPLEDPDGDGVWQVVIPLDAGSYQYKFVVDGSWTADPDNPRTAGDYGNSVVDVGADGAVLTSPGAAAVPSGTPVLSNNDLNSKVYLGGFFRLFMTGTTDVPGDRRLRLETPDNQFNIDPTVNLSQKLWASARLQVTTGTIEPNKLATRLYKAQANFLEDDWGLQAYYNEEAFSSDGYLHLVGHMDLRGTIRRQDRDAGQGTAGLVFRARPFGGDLGFLYSDTYDENIFNPDLPNSANNQVKGFDESTGTDEVALRYALPVGSTQLGLTWRGSLSDWWVDFQSDINVKPQEIADHQDEQIANGRKADEVSDFYELSNDEHVIAVDAQRPLWGAVDGKAALGYRWYEARWALGNREAIQGAGYDDGTVDLPTIGNELGYRGKVGVDYQGEDLKLGAWYGYEYDQGMDADENKIAYRTQPGMRIADKDREALNGVVDQYRSVSGTAGVDALILDPSPERSAHRLGADLLYRRGKWTFEILADRDRENLGYATFFGGDGAAFDRTAWNLSPRLTVRPFADDRFFLSLDTRFQWFDDPDSLVQKGASSPLDALVTRGQGYLARLDRNEAILYGRVPLPKIQEKGMSLRFDLRWVDYNGPEGVRVSTAEGEPVTVDLTETFFQPYLALVWQPADPVEVQVGYGVDPSFYRVITPTGWPNGRQAYRSDYLYEQGLDPYHPYNVLLAEKSLEDRTQLVINAFVRF